MGGVLGRRWRGGCEGKGGVGDKGAGGCFVGEGVIDEASQIDRWRMESMGIVSEGVVGTATYTNGWRMASDGYVRRTSPNLTNKAP